MQTVLKLFKLQIDNKYDLLKTKNIKKMLFSIFKYVLMLAIAVLGVYLVCDNIFILGFKINTQLVAIVLLATQGVSVLFAIGNIITNLYLSKENELLMVLPATSNQIFISKILFIYMQELIISTIYTLPILISLGILGGLGASFYVAIPFLLIFLPLMPISLASLLSIPVMMIIKFLKNHITLTIITILVIVALAITGYMTIIGSITDNFAIASKQIETVEKINASIASFGKYVIIYFQLACAMFSFKQYYWVLMFIGVCAVFIVFCILLIKPFFFKIAMSNMENTTKVLKKEKKFKKHTAFQSLFIKELYTVFRSPSYIFQYFLFTLLMPFIVFTYDKLMLSIAVNQTGQIMIAGSHVLVVAILAMLSNILSASAISREGGNFYISKIAPVNYYQQIFSKLVFNSVFTITALLVTMVVSMFYLNPVHVIIGTIAIIFASIGHIALSIDMDIKKPMLDWYGNEELSKMGGNTAKSMIIGLLIAFALGFIVIMLAFSKTLFLPWLLITILSIVFCIYRIYILILRINLQYDKIEV